LIYVFSREGLAVLDAALAAGPLLAFDVDGTLAPVADRPTEARLPDDVQACLAQLAQRAGVAIITGRAAADALRMLSFEPRHVIGNHGAEGLPGGEIRSGAFIETVRSWSAALRADAALAAAGVLIEDKRYSLSLHYRAAPDHAAASRAIQACIEVLHPKPRIISGKLVINLLPADAPDKGAALRSLMTSCRLSRALYVGDDDTDEAVFRLRLPGVLGLRVERQAGSAAALYLEDQGEMPALLRHIAHAWHQNDGDLRHTDEQPAG